MFSEGAGWACRDKKGPSTWRESGHDGRASGFKGKAFWVGHSIYQPIAISCYIYTCPWTGMAQTHIVYWHYLVYIHVWQTHTHNMRPDMLDLSEHDNLCQPCTTAWWKALRDLACNLYKLAKALSYVAVPNDSPQGDWHYQSFRDGHGSTFSTQLPAAPRVGVASRIKEHSKVVLPAEL